MPSRHPVPSIGKVRDASIATFVFAAFVVGCASSPPAPDESGTDEAPAVLEAATTEFTVPAGMLDTWNAVGQVLVRTDGVAYESRAQMLGLYAVQYRGERMLILTRAQVMRTRADGELTRVYATGPDGAANTGPAATELLAVLRQRLPDELALIAAGGRGTVRTSPSNR